jgi:hypothetical protein
MHSSKLLFVVKTDGNWTIQAEWPDGTVEQVKAFKAEVDDAQVCASHSRFGNLAMLAAIGRASSCASPLFVASQNAANGTKRRFAAAQQSVALWSKAEIKTCSSAGPTIACHAVSEAGRMQRRTICEGPH